MYCVYSTILSKYYNFNNATWCSFNIHCITSDKNAINSIDKKLKPEIHVVTTKPVYNEEAISVY